MPGLTYDETSSGSNHLAHREAQRRNPWGEERSLEVPPVGSSGSWYLVCAARRHSASVEFSEFAERACLWQLKALEQLQDHWAVPATLQGRAVAIWMGPRLARVR
jgi:hypothetical protein